MKELQLDKVLRETLDNLDSAVYISDIDTYELLYANEYVRRQFDFDTQEYPYGKCYAAIQKREKPCEFCNNAELREKGYCVWRRLNSHVDGYYLIHDTLINQQGRNLRVEIALDITEMEASHASVRDTLEAERTLVACVQTLSATGRLHKAIDKVMQSVLAYYGGERAYIFEMDWPNNAANNTYEKCADGVTPQIKLLQNMPLAVMQLWIELFRNQECVYIDDLEAIKDDPARRKEYEVLAPQGISRLLAVPFYYNDKLQGFLGVDNPSRHCRDENFLRTLTYFIGNALEKHHMEERLLRMSYFDTLTGVRNRNSYTEKLEVLTHARPGSIGVAFVDMNGLKYINDTFGHAHGDKALQRLVKILCRYFGEACVYRISGDEFVVLCESWSEERFRQAVGLLLQRLRRDEVEAAAVGYLWDDHGLDIQQMVGMAEQMMYTNKNLYHTNRPDTGGQYRSELIESVEKDIAAGRYVVYLQPKTVIESGKIDGAEALVRRVDENGRIAMPYEFLPMMEKERVVTCIDFFVLEQVCKYLQSWKERGLPLIKMAINISAVTFAEAGFAGRVADICDKYAVEHRLIEIEITDTANESHTQHMQQTLMQLKGSGFSVALDDMGMEYSSLKMIPMDGISVVKLDRSFILTLDKGEDNRIMFEQIIKLCHALGRTCVAEGVDKQAQLSLLNTMECDYVQGFLLSPPIPVEEFEKKYLIAKS